MTHPWVTFFSQTGSEIVRLSNTLNCIPDVIILNSSKRLHSGVCTEFLDNKKLMERLYITQSTPTIEEYLFLIPEQAVVTLHGWLRIIPKEVCESREIYNLHPANLITHPELAGKDPQRRAFEEYYATSGNTIHRCTAQVDGGKIHYVSTVDISNCTTEQGVVNTLKDDAAKLWLQFFDEYVH
jgi:folate-dependent phosphoribosylglycinamide formyltransferase PurN